MLLQHLSEMALEPGSAEAAAREQMIYLLREQPACFERSCFAPGHFTGSALLLSFDGRKTLLTHHRFLDRWLQLGGHCDGDANVAHAALREATEESGISGLELLGDIPADLDVHAIPANPKKGEPPHLHYDVRYFVRAPQDSVHQITEESLDLRWFTPEEALELDLDSSLRRLIGKWRDQFQAK